MPRERGGCERELNRGLRDQRRTSTLAAKGRKSVDFLQEATKRYGHVDVSHSFNALITTAAAAYTGISLPSAPL